MPNTVPAAAAASPSPFDAKLVRLGQELEAVEIELEAVEALGLGCGKTEKKYDRIHDANWALRKKIDGCTATGLAGLFVKARAAELALKDDPSTECSRDGSFVGLAQSMIRDLKVIQAASAEQAAPLAQAITGADAMKLEAELTRQIREGTAALAARRPPMTLRSIFNRLNSATRFVECAWLASGNVKDETDCPSIKAVLDESLCQLHDLAEDVKPLLGDEEEEEEEA